ncbi:hypothetical protein M407DRAFT_245249 [Tulasnella calospora MUT 4182]|uniref:Uncharacterized protein n=1 Tax=Tulasnella calospora MUT 4182 TaxID=1051891 RepID=A0A0C3Q1Q8_9AGAM|nr:hypothetical protein M407DRAFT_245249 [Tulasnella calospora MUT 4182]
MLPSPPIRLNLESGLSTAIATTAAIHRGHQLDRLYQQCRLHRPISPWIFTTKADAAIICRRLLMLPSSAAARTMPTRGDAKA